ncbi:MAG: hypothetical protein AAFO98_09115 [Pseudomonadota bacterium]
MRKFFTAFAVAAIATVVAFATGTTTAEAAQRDYICFTQNNGFQQCRYLPRSYHIPGVARVRCLGVKDCPRPSTSVRLTRHVIRCLAAIVNTSGMVPGGNAVIYARWK